ncbi:hypothetical protein J6590_020494 [Homalodisca vitripennis]|nr:hypothetical protein J6590_020494 [Homalodisca vitripennis]
MAESAYHLPFGYSIGLCKGSTLIHLPNPSQISFNSVVMNTPETVLLFVLQVDIPWKHFSARPDLYISLIYPEYPVIRSYVSKLTLPFHNVAHRPSPKWVFHGIFEESYYNTSPLLTGIPWDLCRSQTIIHLPYSRVFHGIFAESDYNTSPLLILNILPF